MAPSPNQKLSTLYVKNIVKNEENVIYKIKGKCAIILNPLDAIIELISTRPPNDEETASDVATYFFDMSIYKNRLKTFNGWRLDFLTPNQMANAGFYYLGKQDRVRCTFCSQEFDYWCRGDDPLVEHKRKSPQCQFFKENEGYDVCGLYESSTTNLNDQEGNSKIELYLYSVGAVQYMKDPKYKQFASYETRLLTFKMCQSQLKISVHSFSEAGLFYAGDGIDDQVVCFYCGQGLSDWEDGDDPWFEHARWSPTCTYVLLSKGKKFVDKSCPENDDVEVSKNNKEELSKLTVGHEDHEGALMPENKIKDDSMISKIERLEMNENNKMEKSPEVNLHISQTILNTIPDSILCKICFKEEIKVAFIPCCHAIACIQCALTLNDCGVCRQSYNMATRVHIVRNKSKDENPDQLPCSSSQGSLSEPKSEQMTCRVCGEAETEAVFMPCGHVYACVKCASKMHECPVCAETFCATMQVYI